MDRESLQLKVDDLKYKFQKNGAITYYLISGVIVIILIFFLSSNVLFNREANLISSDLNKPFLVDSINVDVTNREYNPENHLIQFNLKIDNLDINTDSNLSVELREKNNPNEIIPTKLVKVSDQDYIIYATLPEKKWSAVSLTFINKNNKTNEIKKVKFYSDSRDISIDNNLKEQNKEGLTIELVNEEIEKVKKEIKDNDIKIENKNKEIDNANSKITSLEKDKEYKTETEIATTDSTITSLKGQVDSLNKDVEKIKKDNKELNDKIDKLNKKKEDLEKMVK
ncbi:coiled-coil domain-containing protein (plasmid) [Clostridium perfringens]